MKNILVFVALLMCVFTSCIKENTPTIPLNNSVDTTVAMLKFTGDFINGPYGRVTGMARLYCKRDSVVLALEDVSISNGPDLHVYISKEVFPVNFIDLGNLQSTNGNQLYKVPAGTAVGNYKYALIHCKQYNHLFGSAELR
jgi:hypothetical protein